MGLARAEESQSFSVRFLGASTPRKLYLSRRGWTLVHQSLRTATVLRPVSSEEASLNEEVDRCRVLALKDAPASSGLPIHFKMI